jgi:hypothetical protein
VWRDPPGFVRGGEEEEKEERGGGREGRESERE